MSNISLSLLLVFKISISLFLFCMLLRKRLLGVSAVKSHGTALWSAAASLLAGGLFVRLLCDPYTVGLPPIPKKLCRFQQDRAKQDQKVKWRWFYRTKALGVACAAVPITRQLHYCPSFSYLEIKHPVLGKWWSGTFHTLPFTALELKPQKKQLQLFISEASRTSGGLGAKTVIGTDSVVHPDLSSEAADADLVT